VNRTTSALLLVALTTQTPRLAAQTIAITGGKVYPVSGPVIEGGTVLMPASPFPATRSGSTPLARSSRRAS
jgi:hypothetical protein